MRALGGKRNFTAGVWPSVTWEASSEAREAVPSILVTRPVLLLGLSSPLIFSILQMEEERPRRLLCLAQVTQLVNGDREIQTPHPLASCCMCGVTPEFAPHG